MNASSRLPRSVSADDAARGVRMQAAKVVLGAAVLGVSLFGAVPAAVAAEVTNPADNPAPITITIDGQQYRDGLDTLPGYDDYACTPIPNVEYDFAENKILYHDDQGELVDTARWIEWDRISSYTTWKKQQQASSPVNSGSSVGSGSTGSGSSPSSSASAGGGSSVPVASSGPAAASSPAVSSGPASSSAPAASPSPSTSTSSSSSSAAASSNASGSSKGSKASSSKGDKRESSSGGASSGSSAGAPATVAGAGTVVKGAGAVTAADGGKTGESQEADAVAAAGGSGGGSGSGGEAAGVPGSLHAAGNALVSGPPAPVGVTPAVSSVGKSVANGAGNTRAAGLLILAVLTIAGLVLTFGNFARRAAFGPRRTGAAVS